MQPHTKIYLDYFNYAADDFIPCEVCGARAVDIHHILRRGMGGSKGKNTIENLMAVCRSCHIKYGDKKQFMDYLNLIHQNKISRSNGR